MRFHPDPNKVLAALVEASGAYWRHARDGMSAGDDRELVFAIGDREFRLTVRSVEDLSQNYYVGSRLEASLFVNGTNVADFDVIHHEDDRRMPSFIGFREYGGASRVMEDWWLDRLEELLDGPRESYPWVKANRPLTPEELAAWKQRIQERNEL